MNIHEHVLMWTRFLLSRVGSYKCSCQDVTDFLKKCQTVIYCIDSCQYGVRFLGSLQPLQHFALVVKCYLIVVKSVYFLQHFFLKKWLLSSGAFCTLHLENGTNKPKNKLVKCCIAVILCLHCLPHGVQLEARVQHVFLITTVNILRSWLVHDGFYLFPGDALQAKLALVLQILCTLRTQIFWCKDSHLCSG